MLVSTSTSQAEAVNKIAAVLERENHREEVTMARPAHQEGTTPPGKRTRIGTLDIIIVIVGVVFIIGYNR